MTNSVTMPKTKIHQYNKQTVLTLDVPKVKGHSREYEERRDMLSEHLTADVDNETTSNSTKERIHVEKKTKPI